MTAMRSGRPWARPHLLRMISSPPAACSAIPCRDPPAPDLLGVIGRALINGVEAGQGSGADVLGHPHNALAWLANRLAADGKGLRAGEIVLTGSLVKTIWLNAGDSVVMELAGLGSVSRDVCVSCMVRKVLSAFGTQFRRPRARGDP